MEYYGISVVGVSVTSENCNNITGEYITGSVSYNDESKTLTLDNATIKGNIGFEYNVKDITITLIGENTIEYGIGDVSGTKTINGTGSLKVSYLDGYYEKNTIIENCSITTSWDYWAIYSDDSKLTIKNANISSEGAKVAIGDFNDIELIDCEIIEPANAQILDTEYNGYAGKFICNEDGTIATKVVIVKKRSKR